MGKFDSLMKGMAGGLGESIGIRDGQSTLPTYSSGGYEAPKTDFVRNRSVGEIDPTEVIPDPKQPRKHFNEEEIERLSADIAARGQLQPIRVRWSADHGKWLIIAGERRWRAVTKAGLSRITCMFIDREMSESEIRAEQLVENLLREDLNGMEEARSFATLMELNGWNATELSQQINVSKGKVSKALSLLKLPEELQARIEGGEISPSTAYELAKVKDEKAQAQLAERAASGEMTQLDVAKVSARPKSSGGKRRSTNEMIKTSDNVRVTITARRDLGAQGLLNALLEAAEIIRARSKKKAA